MTHPLKPPRGLFVPSEVIFDPDLSSALRDTLIQLLALAWRAGGKSTPLLSYDVLTALTGKSKRTIQGHIAALRNNHAALRLQSAGGGEFIVVFDAFLWDTHRRRKNLHSPVKEYKESLKDVVNNNININDPSYSQPSGITTAKKGRRAKNCTAAPPGRELDRALKDELLTAGIFPGLLEEIASSALSDKEIQALLAWCRADSATKPGGLFMLRLRAGAVAPEYFTQPACPRCGKVGEHAAGCYMRYQDGADLAGDTGPGEA